MSQKRIVDIYTAGCPICMETVQMVEALACPSCQVNVLDLNDPEVARRAAALSIRSVPTVVVDGELAACCTGRGVSEEVLRAAGVGQPR
ncbi:MAG: thioredoxin family protein [Rhodothermales bacterium]